MLNLVRKRQVNGEPVPPVVMAAREPTPAAATAPAEAINRRLLALNDICYATNLELELPDVVQRSLGAIDSAVPDTGLAILTYDRNTNLARVEGLNEAARAMAARAGAQAGQLFDVSSFPRRLDALPRGACISLEVSAPDLDAAFRSTLVGCGVGSFLIVGIRGRGESLGFLLALRGPEQRFDNEEQRFFAALGEHLAVAFRNVRVLDRTRQEAQFNAGLLDLEARLGMARGVQNVCDVAVALVSELIVGTRCFLWLQEPERGRLLLAAAPRDLNDQQRAALLDPRLHYAQLPAFTHVLRHRRPLHMPVATLDAAPALIATLEVGTLMLVPLAVGDSLQGVLGLSSPAANIASSALELAASAAQRIGRALEGERTRAAVEQQLARIQLLDRITRAIAKRQELENIFKVVLERLEQDLNVYFSSVYQLDSDNGRLTVASCGARNSHLAVPLGLPQGAIATVAATGLQPAAEGRTFLIPDTSLLKAAVPRALAAQGIGSVVVTPLLIDGHVFGMLLVGRRPTCAFSHEEVEFLELLSEHVALAANQASLRQNLQTAFEELKASQERVIQQERLRALGQMASGIAHDFNNALSPVIGFSELLLEAPERLRNVETATRYLRMINTSGRDAASVVSRLREFYRQRDHSELLQPILLNQLVEQVVDLTQPRWERQAQATGQTIRIATELPELPAFPGNESELREVLTNLIFNAVDALPDGGTIAIRTGHAAQSNGTAQVWISVSDNGMGMTSEVRKRCLEPLFTTKGANGTGLGLAMVHGIVSRHQGRLEVRSDWGHGSTFTIFLPVQSATAQSEAPSPESRLDRRLHVLVVEDEAFVQELVVSYLQADGHSTEIAGDGREALRKFQPGQFDLVLTDRAMPELNGDLLAATIRQLEPEQRIIMLTGFGEFMQCAAERPGGVDLVVAKPVTLSGLRRAIVQVMNAGNSGLRSRSV